ncbi:MAG: TetR family transcriptional regulator [Acidimicrobiales bacterium]
MKQEHVSIATELRGTQQARRRRVMEAAMSLASEGGYEAVQMRDVAERADVALGTVYRYFNSKDHLLAASLVYWNDQLADVLRDAPVTGGDAAQRVANLLERSMRAMSRQPRLVAALLAAMSSLEPGVTECRERVATTMEGLMVRAAGDGAPPDIAERTRILGHVWNSALLSWIHGTLDSRRAVADLEVACRLLL